MVFPEATADRSPFVLGMVSAAVSSALEKAAKRAARIAESDGTTGDGVTPEASFPDASQSAALEKAKAKSRPAIFVWLIGMFAFSLLSILNFNVYKLFSPHTIAPLPRSNLLGPST